MTNTPLSLFPILAEFKIGEWIGPAIVGFFFFVLPILKAVKEAKEKQRQMAEKQGGTATTAESAREAAKRKWEELLRGEEDQPGPWAPPTMADAETPVPAPTARPTAASQPAEPVQPPTFAGSLSPFEPVLSEDEEERSYDEGRSLEQAGSYDEERSARAANEEALRVERLRRAQFLEAERGEMPARADVTSAIAPDRMAEVAYVSADSARRRDVLGSGQGAGFGSRAALRRAILASEILGKPVALRDGSETSGPVGSRR